MTEPDTTAPEIKYASFTLRIVASAIDLFIIMLVAAPIINWILNVMYGPLDATALGETVSQILNQPDVFQHPEKYTPVIWAEISKQSVIGRAVVDNLLQILFIAAYTLPLWFRYSSTPGKMLFRVQIQDAKTYTSMTRKQAIKRFLAYIISFIPFTLGFIWIAFNKKRRGFHDMMAETVAVVKPKKIDNK